MSIDEFDEDDVIEGSSYDEERDQKSEIIGDTATAPDVTDYVVGVRAWTPHMDGQLGEWKPGENVATCRLHQTAGFDFEIVTDPTHIPPEEDCECGFYAYHDLSGFKKNGMYGDVFGAVRGRGKIAVANDGFRAQYAEIVAVAMGPGVEFLDQKDKKQYYDQIEKVGELYNVEVVSISQLEQKAMEYGNPVPDDLRPRYLGPKFGGGAGRTGAVVKQQPKKPNVKKTPLKQKVLGKSEKGSTQLVPGGGYSPPPMHHLGNRMYREANMHHNVIPYALVMAFAIIFGVASLLSLAGGTKDPQTAEITLAICGVVTLVCAVVVRKRS